MMIRYVLIFNYTVLAEKQYIACTEGWVVWSILLRDLRAFYAFGLRWPPFRSLSAHAHESFTRISSIAILTLCVRAFAHIHGCTRAEREVLWDSVLSSRCFCEMRRGGSARLRGTRGGSVHTIRNSDNIFFGSTQIACGFRRRPWARCHVKNVPFPSAQFTHGTL